MEDREDHLRDLIIWLLAIAIASAIVVRLLSDAGVVEVHSGDITSIVTLAVLAILIVFIIPLPLVVWFTNRFVVDDALRNLRSVERTQKYASVGWGILAPNVPNRGIEECKDQLIDALRELKSVSKSMGVIGILSGLVIGLFAPFLLNASGIWRLFFIVLGASSFFPGVGSWLAARYREAGLAIGLLGLSIALTFIIRTYGISFLFFSGLFKIFVLIILIAASVLLAMWIGDSEWDPTLEQEIKEKPFVIVVTALTLALEFISAAYGLWKTIIK